MYNIESAPTGIGWVQVTKDGKCLSVFRARFQAEEYIEQLNKEERKAMHIMARMNEKQALMFASENGVHVGNNQKDKFYEWFKVTKDNNVITIQREINNRGACWKLYGPMVRLAEIACCGTLATSNLRIGHATQLAAEILLDYYK